MKTTAVIHKLLCLISVCGLTACQFSKDSSPSLQLSDSVSLYDPQGMEELMNHHRLSLSQRLMSLEHIKNSFSLSYMGYDLKKKLIGRSGDEIFISCIENEKKSADPIPTFEFYDHIRECLALFQDSHLNIQRKISPGRIATAIASAHWVGSHLYISSIRPNLIKKLEEIQNLPEGALADKIKVGLRLVSIDDKTPLQAVNDLKKYISASSPEAEKLETTEALFARVFSYPTKNSVNVVIEGKDGKTESFSLPWVVLTNNAVSLESEVHLRKKEFSFADELDPNKKLMSTSGYQAWEPIFPEQTERQIFVDTSDGPAISTGLAEMNLDGQPVKICYLSINTFDVALSGEFDYAVFKKEGETTITRNLFEVTRDFSQDCETKKRPMILDLRENGGGDSTLSAKIFQLFSRGQSPQLFEAKSISAGPGNISFILELLRKMSSVEPQVLEKLFYLAAKEAALKNEPVTPWMIRREATPTTDVFNGPLLILISPSCISACDNIANRFRLSGRGLLIGSPTNGTGFGYMATTHTGTVLFDPANSFEISIPNQAFSGKMISDWSGFEADAENIGTLMPFSEVSLLENAPTFPDVPYSLTPTDLKNYQDYQEFLKQLLEKQNFGSIDSQK